MILMRRSHRGATSGYHCCGHQRKALGGEGAKVNLKFHWFAGVMLVSFKECNQSNMELANMDFGEPHTRWKNTSTEILAWFNVFGRWLSWENIPWMFQIGQKKLGHFSRVQKIIRLFKRRVISYMTYSSYLWLLQVLLPPPTTWDGSNI